jgi:hypothetical protein
VSVLAKIAIAAFVAIALSAIWLVIAFVRALWEEFFR